MNTGLADLISSYLRELSKHRMLFLACYILVAVCTASAVVLWPKTYTSFALIYADNSNVIQPLLDDTAKATSITDQSRMAREILFKRDYADEMIKAAGLAVDTLSSKQKDELHLDIQEKTSITNVGERSANGDRPTSLIRIAFSDSNPVKAFSVVQKYTSLFIDQSVVKKRGESKSAFNFIQSEVDAYQRQLQQAEKSLSDFKIANNNGTLADANARISKYKTDIEALELELVQLKTEEAAVEHELSGEAQVSKNLKDMVALRNRINSLQIQQDTLRSRFHDNHPEVVQLQTQIDDLMAMYETGDPGLLIQEDDLDKSGVTPLHQELRSRIATIKTSVQTKNSQLSGLKSLMQVETQRVNRINETDAELAELTRGYNVKKDFYNDLLKKLENSRVTMHLDEELQGYTFKVQEAAAIPAQPDGRSVIKLLMGSFLLAFATPLGILIVLMEFDPRIRSESDFKDEWPPLLISIPPLNVNKDVGISNKSLSLYVGIGTIILYGAAILLSSLYSGKDLL